MTQAIQTTWDSPIGRLRISIGESDTGSPRCVGLYFAEHHPTPRHWCDDARTIDWRRNGLAGEMIGQLQAYFSGDCRRFSVSTGFIGTEFQNRVWHELTRIPFGQTRSYRDIAVSLGRAEAVRAVASAIARNPISIILPCHRVVSSSGKLAGFAGGLDRKRFLLEHEAVCAAALTISLR